MLDTAKSLWHLKHVVLIIMQGYTVMVQLDFGAYQLLLHYIAIQAFKGSYHTHIIPKKKQLSFLTEKKKLAAVVA